MVAALGFPSERACTPRLGKDPGFKSRDSAFGAIREPCRATL